MATSPSGHGAPQVPAMPPLSTPTARTNADGLLGAVADLGGGRQRRLGGRETCGRAPPPGFRIQPKRLGPWR